MQASPGDNKTAHELTRINQKFLLGGIIIPVDDCP
jgi:hypothetical protein